MAKSIELWEALAVTQQANGLIERYHGHLREARILYLFTTQKRKHCDRSVVATAKKMSALTKFLSSGMQSVAQGHDFIVVIGQAEWDSLRPEQRIAMLDHQLSHCWRFEKETKNGTKEWWGIKAHDIEEFTDVLDRHGAWNRRQKEAAEVLIRQLALDLADRVPDPDVDDVDVSLAAPPELAGVPGLMHTISKAFGFSAAHQLDGLGPDHPCSNLHGHNYTATVELTGAPDAIGMVLDYRDLLPFKVCVDRLDHRNLNEVPGLGNPTAENLAAYLFEYAYALWPELVTAVSVAETPETLATFRRPHLPGFEPHTMESTDGDA